MSSTLEQKPIYRELAPVSHRVWLQEQSDEAEVLQAQLAKWLSNVSSHEALFRRHVYENPDMTEFDLRQHRAVLFAMIADGEMLAVEYIKWGAKQSKIKEIQASVNLLDEQVAKLLQVLYAWHSNAKDHPDIPESFKQAMQEVVEGKLVDLDI